MSLSTEIHESQLQRSISDGAQDFAFLTSPSTALCCLSVKHTVSSSALVYGIKGSLKVGREGSCLVIDDQWMVYGQAESAFPGILLEMPISDSIKGSQDPQVISTHIKV